MSCCRMARSPDASIKAGLASLILIGSALQQHFLVIYGIDEPDQDRLAFHLMLDEFF